MDNRISTNKKYKTIAIIIDYFGTWPDWFPLFIESCRYNPTIDWIFHTDCDFKDYELVNVKFYKVTKEAFVKNVNQKLKVNFSLVNNYKLCDLKPMCGLLYEEEIKDYDFYGYGDIDVIYGNIRKFYTPEVLQNNVISTHNWCVSGHLALFRNTNWMRESFKRYKGWEKIIEDQECQRFDEDHFINVFKYPNIDPKMHFFYDLINIKTRKYRKKLYFFEQFTTPLTPSPWCSGSLFHPETWYWKDGTVTNEKDGSKEYIYLHFMNFYSGRWMNSMYKREAVWKELDKIINLTSLQMRECGMVINRQGFHIY